jgi:hypothetical protein
VTLSAPSSSARPGSAPPPPSTAASSSSSSAAADQDTDVSPLIAGNRTREDSEHSDDGAEMSPLASKRSEDTV